MTAVGTARATVPWQQVVDQVRDNITRMEPALESVVAQLPRAAFGVESGFFYMPIAQALEWGERDREWLDRVATVFGLGHLYYVLHDRLVDVGALSPRSAVLMDTALACYLRTGSELGTGADAFVRAHQAEASVYAGALLRDIVHNERPELPYAAEEVFRLGEKAAPGNLALLVVATRCRRADQVPGLSSAVTVMCSALQLLDDLQDLRDDWAEHNVTFPVSLGLAALPRPDRDLAPFDEFTAEDVLNALYLSGGAAGTLRIALRCLARAGEALARTDATVLQEIAREWTATARAQLTRAEARDSDHAHLG
ncbi:hypothetical protein [Streptomyces sp. AK02-01A]|uniref:hypothetical protein n=1 Tax=Streptomyces sp. AK02-01A TaxID=3028648 RepID=UPI0029B65A92|nr:hypothetical protein [Streptomyces sp. AK02-01A]MDX3854751.1 hypothetical protein [Streptomyces sp. AK02-01A]